MLEKPKNWLKNLIPGVDRVWEALDAPDLSPGAKIAGWGVVAGVLVIGFWVLV